MQKNIGKLTARLAELGDEPIEVVVEKLTHEMAALEQARSDVALLLRMLEELRRSLLEHVPRIAKAYYADRPLPLVTPERTMLGRVHRLFDALASHYGYCLEQSDDAQTSAGMLHRVIDAHANRMIEDYRARQIIGRGAWEPLHLALARAEQLQAGKIAVHDPLHPNQKSTIHTAYGRAVLLVAAQAGAMKPRSLEATLALINLLEPFIDCTWQADGDSAGRRSGANRQDESLAGFALEGVSSNTGHDHSLERPSGRMRVLKAAGMTHLLNTNRLAAALKACFSKLMAGEPISALEVLPIDRNELAALLDRLQQVWCGGEVREEARLEVAGETKIANGLVSIYRLISGGEFTIPKDFRVYNVGQPLGETETEVREIKDTGGIGNWRLLDCTSDGLRAARSAEGSQFRRGTLACVGPEGTVRGQLALAEVRWVQEDASMEAPAIMAGIKLLQGRVTAVPARVSGLMSGNWQDVGPVFLLEKVTPPRLVMPLNWWGADRIVDIYRNGEYQRLQTGELLLRGGDYEICRFTIGKYSEFLR